MKVFGFGFGKLQKDFWLGLDHLNFFTNQEKSTELLVELFRNGKRYFALYEQFSVGNRRSDYKLSVGGYSSISTLPDSLSHNNGFSLP